jgi:hypothetical protein
LNCYLGGVLEPDLLSSLITQSDSRFPSEILPPSPFLGYQTETHKLKDSEMMRSFMTSGSLTWGTDHNEGPDGSGTTPFPDENAVMMVFEGRPLFGGGGVACPA